MLTTTKRRAHQYDIDFVDLMNRVAQSRRQIEARPMDYGRLGGAAFSRMGESQAAISGAALGAEGGRLYAQDAGDAYNRMVANQKRAEADKLKAEALTELLGGGTKLAMGAASTDPGFTDFSRQLYPGWGAGAERLG